MIQCKDCELCEMGPDGAIHFKCNPFVAKLMIEIIMTRMLRTRPMMPHIRPALAWPRPTGSAWPASICLSALPPKTIARLPQIRPMIPQQQQEPTIEMIPSTSAAVAPEAGGRAPPGE